MDREEADCFEGTIELTQKGKNQTPTDRERNLGENRMTRSGSWATLARNFVMTDEH